MKKFTLLAAVAMIAGAAFAQDEPAEINGLKLSSGNDTTQFNFYRIRNMRAMRLDYTSGVLRNQNGDSINRDGGGFYMSPTLTDGVTPTPNINDNPYMGLSQLDGNWWLSFSNQEEIKDADTEYWYFTWGGKRNPETVFVRNAVVKGSVSDTARQAADLAGYRRSNMDFNNRSTNRYYVLSVRPAFEKMAELNPDENWVDSILKNLDEEDFNRAFALCLNDTITQGAGDCLDMNNYVNIKQYIEKLDDNEDPILDDNGNKTYWRYGFAGVDRTWTPITTTANKNHWENNGTFFIVEEAPAADAIAAIERYAEKIKDGYREGAKESSKIRFATAASTIEAWKNVPALFNAEYADELDAIIASCRSWNGEGLESFEVSDADSREAYIAEAEKVANTKLAEAAKYVGSGRIVTFQNQLALRDLNTFLDGTSDPELQLGNAYLCAGGNITYKDGQYVEEVYDLNEGMGIVPALEPQEGVDLWELIPVPGTHQFYLYNAKCNVYIRRYHDMYDYCGGDEYLPAEGLSEFSWGATDDITEAAPFEFEACLSEEDQTQPSEDELVNMGYCDLDLSVTDKVRLVSKYTYTTYNSAGVPTTTDYVHNIHRGSVGSDYKFINWTTTHNNWCADSNAFLVHCEKEGGISEINADKASKAHGIYDLQGRRVAKAQKGVYIVDGVKTFVR